MSQIDTYQTLSAPSQAEFKDKGSRFIAYAYPILAADEVKNIVENVRQQHHKARHWCYAYRLGVDGNQFRANDDGEPSGSAGRPILGQIDSFELTDVLVVVVRYFGGTLLGVSGLIRAYKTSTQMALQAAQIIEKNIDKTVTICCDYAYLHDAIHIAKSHQARIVQQDLQLNCCLTVAIPSANWSACMQAWQQTRFINILDE